MKSKTYNALAVASASTKKIPPVIIKEILWLSQSAPLFSISAKIFATSMETAEEAGNSPEMIAKHYKELVRPKAAAKFWQMGQPMSQGDWYNAFFDDEKNFQ